MNTRLQVNADLSGWILLGLLGVISLQYPLGLGVVGAIALGLGLHQLELDRTRWFRRLGGWRVLGAIAGVLLFVAILLHPEPAAAQLFDSVEDETNSIFGTYIDQSIIQFLFGMLRIVIWVSAVGFVFFAVYQAQRGEQWQPLLQNAFIIIAAVVVVEGLSQLFFGST
ncbi:MAG: hypothetical protein AAFV72_14870 [Cyanobacteria bacterium J06635_1]